MLCFLRCMSIHTISDFIMEIPSNVLVAENPPTFGNRSKRMPRAENIHFFPQFELNTHTQHRVYLVTDSSKCFCQLDISVSPSPRTACMVLLEHYNCLPLACLWMHNSKLPIPSAYNVSGRNLVGTKRQAGSRCFQTVHITVLISHRNGRSSPHHQTQLFCENPLTIEKQQFISSLIHKLSNLPDELWLQKKSLTCSSCMAETVRLVTVTWSASHDLLIIVSVQPQRQEPN